MLYNFNFNFKDITGKTIPIDAANAGIVLGDALWSSNLADSITIAEVARKMFNHQPVEISDELMNTIKDFIDKNQRLTVLSKEGLLTSIKSQQEKQKAKESKKGK